jgi:hypothetical protein
MNTQSIQVEADSLELARQELKARLPSGWFVQSEQVLSDGRPQTSRGMAETDEEALAKAKAGVPSDSTILETKTVQNAGTRTIAVEAETESAAQAKLKTQLGSSDILKSFQAGLPGKKGFLGIGKTLDQFQAVVLRQAIVEITHKKKALLKVTITDQIASWEPLLAAMENAGTGGTNLFEQFPHQALFAPIGIKLGGPAGFKDIPFVRVTPELIQRIKRYVDNPPIPPMIAAFGGSLDPNRYAVQGGRVGRMSNMMIDGLIASTADCLKGRGNFSLTDQAGISKCAYDAIIHYSELPAAAFCFSLPYLDKVVKSRLMVLEDFQISTYKGTEGLLLEIYEALPEGGLITDRLVLERVRALLA